MVIEIGRLVYDVEVKTVGEGPDAKKVLNNRLAIAIGKDKSTYIDIVAWDKRAEFIGNNFKKGNELYLEGQLINTTKMKKDIEYDTVVLQVSSVKFTHGNPRE